MTPTQLADELGYSPKTIRQYLREEWSLYAPGQGGIWSLSNSMIRDVRRRFPKR